MFNFELKRRIKALEEDAAKRRQELACATGRHKWELRDADKRVPFIRCSECYAYPEDKKA